MASPTVRVGSFWKSSKCCYYLKWKDPHTGKWRTQQTDITRRNQRGEKAAAALASEKQKELGRHRRSASGSMTWEAFQEMYRERRLNLTSRDNQAKFRAASAFLDEVITEDRIGPLWIEDVSPILLLRVEEQMRKRLAPGSIASYSATLRAAFGWAAKVGLMHTLPHRPPETVEYLLPAMRLQVITGEHLDRILAAVPKVVGRQHAAGVSDYIRALWLGGCRLIEPSLMHSNRLDLHHPIVLHGEHPMMAWTSWQKNKRDQIAPITLDFASFLRPRCEGHRFIFNPTCEHGRIESKHQLSKVIAEVGKRSKVIAEPATQKTVTAKHFRSSFVSRWSSRGMPLEHVQRIVRHSSPATTERYYLAPASREMVPNFRERDWVDLAFGDQLGDQRIGEPSRNPGNYRGDGGIRTHE